MLHVVQRELHYIVNISLAVLDHIIHMSSCDCVFVRYWIAVVITVVLALGAAQTEFNAS